MGFKWKYPLIENGKFKLSVPQIVVNRGNWDLFVTSAMLVFARNSNLAPYIIFDGSDYFVQFRAT